MHRKIFYSRFNFNQKTIMMKHVNNIQKNDDDDKGDDDVDGDNDRSVGGSSRTRNKYYQNK